MSDLNFILLTLAVFGVAIYALFWVARRFKYGGASKRFIEKAEDFHGRAFAAKTEEGRNEARDNFEALVEEGVNSSNSLINNRDTAERLKRFIDFTLDMAVADEQRDIDKARSWGERCTEKLQPMYYKARIK